MHEWVGQSEDGNSYIPSMLCHAAIELQLKVVGKEPEVWLYGS